MKQLVIGGAGIFTWGPLMAKPRLWLLLHFLSYYYGLQAEVCSLVNSKVLWALLPCWRGRASCWSNVGQQIGRCTFPRLPQPCPLQGRQLDSLGADMGSQAPHFPFLQGCCRHHAPPCEQTGIPSMELQRVPWNFHCPPKQLESSLEFSLPTGAAREFPGIFTAHQSS